MSLLRILNCSFPAMLAWVLSGVLLTLGGAQATGTPAGTVIRNTAVFDSDSGSVNSNPVSVTVTAVCALNLTPTARTLTVQAGERAVFSHVLTNVGNAPGSFPVPVTGDGTALFADRNGNGQPDDGELVGGDVTLAADQSVTLMIVGTPDRITADTGTLWTLTATCAGGESSQSARDTLITSGRALILTKTLQSASQLQAGDTAKYLLTLTNPNRVAVRDVRLSDALPPEESFTEAQPAPSVSPDSGLAWNLGTFQPGESRQFLLITAVRPDVRDNALVVNTARASSSDLPGEVTASAQFRVFTTTLLIQKSVAERTVDLGDLLHYTVNIGNPSNVNLTSAVLTDVPATGLRYVAGSTKIGGVTMPDPNQTGGALIFMVGDLKAGGTQTVTYTLQVTPQAPQNPVNTARAVALASNGAEVGVSVASNTSVAQVSRQAGLFGGKGEIIGRVYVDNSHVGHYSEGLDLPVAGARILLAGGQEALSDAQGRYHFADLTPGTYALRLDPASTAWSALPWPGDTGRAGSRNVDVWGLTNIDFPLKANTGSAK